MDLVDVALVEGVVLGVLVAVVDWLDVMLVLRDVDPVLVPLDVAVVVSLVDLVDDALVVRLLVTVVV